MKKLILLCIFCLSTPILSHEFEEISGSHILVDTIELSGDEIWDRYFSRPHTFLVLKRRNQPFRLIRQPEYMGQNTPKSMQVCDEEQNDEDSPCNDPFYHVHSDQFMMGKSVAERLCDDYGPYAVVEFLYPSNFVGGDGSPYSLHHTKYKLVEGLIFNCWIDTAATM
ncbi:hypothetical protein [Marinicella sp. W31]|uniref:hypothetical protein n=1 Tax=Marinicella sp. W31 TaxID=3023713 RepID=UPI00375688B2